jgi:hypothetical protein
MEKYSNSDHPTAYFAKLGQQPNNWAQLMPRLPPLNPQFKLSKKIFLHPLLSSNTNTQNPGPAPGSHSHNLSQGGVHWSKVGALGPLGTAQGPLGTAPRARYL